MAFSQPEAAIQAAVAIQLELLKADWLGPAITARIGIHQGAADERNGDPSDMCR